jgi:hypothetical protein
MAIRPISLPFSKFYGHLVYFVVILVHFSVCRTEKNLATLDTERHGRAERVGYGGQRGTESGSIQLPACATSYFFGGPMLPFLKYFRQKIGEKIGPFDS